MINNVSIFCSSSDSIDEYYFKEAYGLGTILASMNITCYTGAGNNGLMLKIQEGVIENNGRCIGVIPKFMVEKGWLHNQLSQVIEVETMSERKEILRENADAIIVLPGGIGTFDEFYETLALKQLGFFAKPIIVLNTNNYFDLTIKTMEYAINKNFIDKSNENLMKVVTRLGDIEKMLRQLT